MSTQLLERHSFHRTDLKTERLVVTRIAMGMKYQEIFEDIGVPVSTIKKIKRRNVELLLEIKQVFVEREADLTARLLQKSHLLLDKRLNSAIAGKETIPIKDLVSIAKVMSSQVEDNNKQTEDKPIERSLTPEDQKTLRIAYETADSETVLNLLFPNN